MPDFFGRITGAAARDSDQITYIKDLGWGRLRLQQQFYTAFYNILSEEGQPVRKWSFGNRDINLTKCCILTITDTLASIRTVKIVP